MAQPVEDDVSLLEGREGTTQDYPGHTTTKDYRSALRPPPPLAPGHDRKAMTAGRVSGGSGSSFSPSSSPVTSPRTPEATPNYNIDASASIYALQVALKNMKDRYHKLQKKMAFVEDDNQRLITGKSELIGEIGKLQENSIKLREKNLQLNQEIYTKHQDCCSLKEKCSSLSSENMTLNRQLARATQDNRRLSRQVNQLNDENNNLKEKLRLIASQLKAVPGGAGLAASASELTSPRAKTFSITDDHDGFEDLSVQFNSPNINITLDECEEVNCNEIGDFSSTRMPTSFSCEEKMIEAVTLKMKNIVAIIHDQNNNLQRLSPSLNSLHLLRANPSANIDLNKERILPSVSEKDDDDLVSQRDQDLSTLTLTPSTYSHVEEQKVQDDEGTCQSRLATYGSVLHSSFVSAGGANGGRLDSSRHESGGDPSVPADQAAGGGVPERPRSPFDWRQVQVSDDEGREGEYVFRPDTRTVSTSPDPTLEEEDERVCPMCNAVFPRVIPQDSFESHVVSHFEAENGFEVIP